MCDKTQPEVPVCPSRVPTAEGTQVHDLKCYDPVSQSVLVGGIYIRWITW